MYAHLLPLLTALLFLAIPPSAPQHGGAPTSNDTIIERVRLELVSALDAGVEAAGTFARPAWYLHPYLTWVGDTDSIAEPPQAPNADERNEALGARPPFRRGTVCWWLWLLSGATLCW